jgi:hypothetical protein
VWPTRASISRCFTQISDAVLPRRGKNHSTVRLYNNTRGAEKNDGTQLLSRRPRSDGCCDYFVEQSADSCPRSCKSRLYNLLAVSQQLTIEQSHSREVGQRKISPLSKPYRASRRQLRALRRRWPFLHLSDGHRPPTPGSKDPPRLHGVYIRMEISIYSPCACPRAGQIVVSRWLASAGSLKPTRRPPCAKLHNRAGTTSQVGTRIPRGEHFFWKARRISGCQWRAVMNRHPSIARSRSLRHGPKAQYLKTQPFHEFGQNLPRADGVHILKVA